MGCRAQSMVRSVLVVLCSERQAQCKKQLETPLGSRSFATETECWKVIRIGNHETRAHSIQVQRVPGLLVRFHPRNSVVEVDHSSS